MNITTFKLLVSRWISEKVIPSAYPDEEKRAIAVFLFNMKGVKDLSKKIDGIWAELPMKPETMELDVDEYEADVKRAFEAQPKVPFVYKHALGEIKFRFAWDDVKSLFEILRGNVTRMEVTL